MVIAAVRAATIATMIHTICRNVGQPCAVARAASSAPVSANGKAKTECSNLIISSTVPIRPDTALRSRLAPGRAADPPIHFILRQTGLRQHAAHILRNDLVERLWLEVKRRH